jgi:hypothetical protein
MLRRTRGSAFPRFGHFERSTLPLERCGSERSTGNVDQVCFWGIATPVTRKRDLGSDSRCRAGSSSTRFSDFGLVRDVFSGGAAGSIAGWIALIVGLLAISPHRTNPHDRGAV